MPGFWSFKWTLAAVCWCAFITAATSTEHLVVCIAWFPYAYPKNLSDETDDNRHSGDNRTLFLQTILNSYAQFDVDVTVILSVPEPRNKWEAIQLSSSVALLPKQQKGLVVRHKTQNTTALFPTLGPRHRNVALPWTCRIELMNARETGRYQYFAYTEDDILLRPEAFAAWRRDVHVLWSQGKFLRGFYRVECSDLALTCNQSRWVSTDIIHQINVAEWQFTLQRANRSFIQLSNPYAAMWVYTLRQMDYFLASPVYLPEPLTQERTSRLFKVGGMRASAAVGFQAWRPPAPFRARNVIPYSNYVLDPSAAVFHLPNTYYRKFGSKMEPGRKLRKFGQQNHGTVQYLEILWNCSTCQSTRPGTSVLTVEQYAPAQKRLSKVSKVWNQGSYRFQVSRSGNHGLLVSQYGRRRMPRERELAQRDNQIPPERLRGSQYAQYRDRRVQQEREPAQQDNQIADERLRVSQDTQTRDWRMRKHERDLAQKDNQIVALLDQIAQYQEQIKALSNEVTRLTWLTSHMSRTSDTNCSTCTYACSRPGVRVRPPRRLPPADMAADGKPGQEGGGSSSGGYQGQPRHNMVDA